jgi:hypothetical protein
MEKNYILVTYKLKKTLRRARASEKIMGLRRLWLHFKIAIAIERRFAFSLFSI